MTAPLNLACVIVAGGKSSRMGRDKALLPFGGYTTLTQYQLAKHKADFASLHVSCKDKTKFDFAASFIEDIREFDTYSPLVALYSILRKLDQPVAILSVDTPFVDRNIYEKLADALGSNDVAIASSPFGSHQLCGIYKPSILPLLREQIQKDRHKIREVLDQVSTVFVDFPDDAPFDNLNHIEEYEAAKERA